MGCIARQLWYIHELTGQNRWVYNHSLGPVHSAAKEAACPDIPNSYGEEQAIVRLVTPQGRHHLQQQS